MSNPVFAHWWLLISQIGSSNETVTVWSGEGEIRHNGRTFTGLKFGNAQLASISAVEAGSGIPSSYVRVQVYMPTEAWKELFAFDWGSLYCELGFITSTNLTSWADQGKVRGYMSSPELKEEIFAFDIVPPLADVEHKPFPRWSAERSSVFKDIKQLEAGFQTSWPP